jgi:hypothetical protein
MKLADSSLWPLSYRQLLSCLDLAQQVEQTTAALKLHLLREADSRDVARLEHAHATEGWFATRSRVKYATARQAVSVAAALDRRPVLDQALTTAAVNTEQAAVIADCVTSLPAEIGTEAIDKAERLLIAWAADFDANGLRKLAARILEHVAPEIAEAREAAALAKEEEGAHADRFLILSNPYRGRVRLKGCFGTEAAAVIEAALEPLCAPRNRPLTGAPELDHRRPEQIRADALVEVCSLALRTGDLPVNGGEPPQVSVTVSFDPLAEEVAAQADSGDGPSPEPPAEQPTARETGRQRRKLGVGTLGNGQRVSPDTVRRLACDARLLPAVLGTAGQVLDVGRARRLIDGSLRRALTIRDQGCTFPGCTRPARWTEAHHIASWAAGGSTSLQNAVLLCQPHHRTIHDTDWAVHLAPDGHPLFVPPPHLDPQQRPRRNVYHRRT